MPVSSIHTGWRRDPANSRLDMYYQGTRVGHIDATGLTVALAATITGAQTFTGAATFSSTGTFTGAVTGNVTGDAFLAPTGNINLGNAGAFATTQPQGAVIMGGTSLGGVAPVGAITTAGAVFASDTVVRKIIADGTASNVET